MRKSRGSVFDLAMDSTVAATSTAMTLWHRLPMFGFTSLASNVERQAEATRMVDEKGTAFVEGMFAANMEAVRVMTAAAAGQFESLLHAPFTIATAGLKPAYRTVNANARRLNRKAARSG
jgi:hypothetical protein